MCINPTKSNTIKVKTTALEKQTLNQNDSVSDTNSTEMVLQTNAKVSAHVNKCMLKITYSSIHNTHPIVMIYHLLYCTFPG